MLEQVYFVQRDIGQRIGHIVMMGIGEPLDNYDAVLQFLRMISDPNGLNIGQRNISLSTCGVVPRIRQLQKEQLGITLSISLHAPFDEMRSQTMPINRQYPIAELLEACREYAAATGRRISFEYALIRDFNDSRRCAEELVSLLHGMLCHVNLIPVNEIRETDYRKSNQQSIRQFEQYLNQHGITATVRRTLGADINAACGQLRREQIEEA
jgi:23S rRNA (adenine2503-C2)-methyltransferase